MNDDILQMSSIVRSARKALRSGKEIDDCPGDGVAAMEFTFLTRDPVFRSCRICKSVKTWFAYCLDQKLEDIKFLIDTEAADRSELEAVNGSGAMIVCYWKGGRITSFYSNWTMNREKGGWFAAFKEREWVNLPTEKPAYYERTEEFKQTLFEIGQLAKEMGFTYYLDVFGDAYYALDRMPPEEIQDCPADVPVPFRRIYRAVLTADVFGGSDYWNSFPAVNGIPEEFADRYERLTNRLLEQVRYHLMYLTNECWERFRGRGRA